MWDCLGFKVNLVDVKLIVVSAAFVYSDHVSFINIVVVILKLAYLLVIFAESLM